MKVLKDNLLNIVLAVLVVLFLIYLFSKAFREFLVTSGIDAGLVTGFIASFALIVSIQQGMALKKQSVRDKNFAYRLSIKSKFEDMSQLVIAKLYSLDARRHACVATMENLKKCLGTDIVYRDGYNITETEAFGSDSFRSTAALDVYFPSESKKWNEVIDILNEMGSIASTALLNYTENDNGRNRTNFLDEFDTHVERVKELDEKMGNKPQEIREGIIEEVNKHVLNLTKV